MEAPHAYSYGVDPEYVRRFAESTHLYDGDGYEVNEPLATKMEAQPHDAKPFDLLNSQYRYYDYEFERYWHFFQVFGRIGYNPETSPDLWQKEFEKRFGKKACTADGKSSPPGQLDTATHNYFLLSLQWIPDHKRLGRKTAAW